MGSNPQVALADESKRNRGEMNASEPIAVRLVCITWRIGIGEPIRVD